MFLAGSIYKYVINVKAEPKVFDYSVADSIFNSAEIIDSATNLVQKKVASDAELLDFSGYNLSDTLSGSVNNLNININTAGIEELCLLPGIGKKTAEKIISYRLKNGDFTQISDVIKVNGIGNKKFEKIKEFIKVE